LKFHHWHQCFASKGIKTTLTNVVRRNVERKTVKSAKTNLVLAPAGTRMRISKENLNEMSSRTGIGHWTLDTGHWTLDIGHWALMIDKVFDKEGA
jgi:hypothetical protein